MKQPSTAFRVISVLGVLAFLAMLGAQPARGQGNSAAAQWCAANFPPAQRGQCVSQAAHGAGPFSTCGPGGTNVGLCGGVGGVCCAASEVCEGLLCQSGCRIGGTFFAAGASNPANTCQSCQPAVSTTAWTNVANGTSCTDGNTCTQTDTCQAGACTGTNAADGTTCDAGTDGGVLTCTGGTCGSCATNPSASPRFVDNGDGTITDRHTCLVWEKKDDAGAIHDKDNRYSWCIRYDPPGGGPAGCANGTGGPDGGLFTEFLDGLNNATFAGHKDWRLPSEDGLKSPFTGPRELEGIVDRPGGITTCGTAPCVDAPFNTACGADSLGNPGCTVDGADGTTKCSCTVSGLYWSSTEDTGGVWVVNFGGGDPYAVLPKYDDVVFVRAVRGGL